MSSINERRQMVNQTDTSLSIVKQCELLSDVPPSFRTAKTLHFHKKTPSPSHNPHQTPTFTTSLATESSR